MALPTKAAFAHQDRETEHLPRPVFANLKACIVGLDDNAASKQESEEAVIRIWQRWRMHQYLGLLYQSSSILADYATFRHAAVNTAGNYNGFKRPRSDSFVYSTLARFAQDSDRELATSNLERIYTMDSDFKSRFHKACCARSIAQCVLTASRAAEDTRAPLKGRWSLLRPYFELVQDIFYGKQVPCNRGLKYASQPERLDALEVFDFFFVYLVRRLLFKSYRTLPIWTYEGYEPQSGLIVATNYVDPEEHTIGELELNEVERFFMDCAFALNVADIYKLIQMQSWTREVNPVLPAFSPLGEQGYVFNRSNVVHPNNFMALHGSIEPQNPSKWYLCTCASLILALYDRSPFGCAVRTSST